LSQTYRHVEMVCVCDFPLGEVSVKVVVMEFGLNIKRLPRYIVSDLLSTDGNTCMHRHFVCRYDVICVLRPSVGLSLYVIAYMHLVQVECS